MTIAPAHKETGTNGLILSPLDVLDFQFGLGSFEKHCRAARAKNCELAIFRNAGLEFDIDRPADLQRLISITRGSNTATLLSEMAEPLAKRRDEWGKAS